MKTLDQALVLNENYAPTLLAKARMLIAQKKYKDALPLVTKAINADPNSTDALMLRGWLNKKHLKNATAANADFEKVLTFDADEIESLRGFALHELGRDNEATAWAEKMIQDYSPTGGEDLLLCCCPSGCYGQQGSGHQVPGVMPCQRLWRSL